MTCGTIAGDMAKLEAKRTTPEKAPAPPQGDGELAPTGSQGGQGSQNGRQRPRKRPGGRHAEAARALVIVESPTKAKTHRQVPRVGLRREGHRRPHPRSAHPEARRRRRQRLRAEVRHHQGQDQDARRAQEGGQDGQRDLTSRPTLTARARRSPGTWPTRSSPRRRLHRVLFHEITKDAVQEAIAKPGKIDDQKVNAQQARRILDRLVGLQGEPHPLEEHQDRPLRRPGADRGAPADRRARAGDPRVQAAGVLDASRRQCAKGGQVFEPSCTRSTATSRSCTNDDGGAGGRGRP